MFTCGVQRFEGVALVACERVASGDWLEVAVEACACGIPTQIRICCKLRLKCVLAHVARRPLAATCASRRSEISCRVSTSAAASPRIERCKLQHRPCACLRPRSAQRDGRAQGWRGLCPDSMHAAVRVISKLSSPTRRQLREAGASRRGTAHSWHCRPRPSLRGRQTEAQRRSPRRGTRKVTKRKLQGGCGLSPLHGLAEGVRHVHPQQWARPVVPD